MIRALVLAATLFLSVTSASAATRLGLHVTAEELAVWQARMTDNVNTINGYSFQAIYNARIKADADDFVGQSHPGGDGHWEGYTGAGCAPNDETVNPGSGGTPFGRGNGHWMMRSAFNFLLTNDTDYADPVRTELLQQITETGTDWTNSSKWCVDVNGGSNSHHILPWLYRLVISYDYLIAGGYSGFSAQEKTDIKSWFSEGATYWASVHNRIVNENSNYPGANDTPQDMTCVGDCTSLWGATTHLNGWDVRSATLIFFNQTMPWTALAMAVGIITNDSALIEVGVKWFTAFTTAGIYDDGAEFDYIYHTDCTPNCPGGAWGHAGGVWAGLTAIADMYARNGNTSLYDLLVATQVLGGNGGTVGLRTLLTLPAQLVNGTTIYRTNDDSTNLDSTDPTYGAYYFDFASMVANLYYRDSEITTANSRTIGGNTSGSCGDSNFSCFSGMWASWADLPYMFGNMENDAANPFFEGGSGELRLQVIRGMQ